MRSRVAFLATIAALAALAGGCSQPTSDPLAERGRQVYLAQCTQCHNVDPAQDGAVGPAVKGSSRELLEARILKGTYPPGYRPKRPTNVMPPQPAVAPEILALAAYLRQPTREMRGRLGGSGTGPPNLIESSRGKRYGSPQLDRQPAARMRGFGGTVSGAT